MIVWNGMDIISLVVLGICVVLLGLAWLWDMIQNAIDKYFEEWNNDDN